VTDSDVVVEHAGGSWSFRRPANRREIVMNPIRTIRRLAVLLAGLAATVLASIITASAAFAWPDPPGGPAGLYHFRPTTPVVTRTVTHTVVTGGMPGWQITLIAVAAALLAATVAVLADRARASCRQAATAAA